MICWSSGSVKKLVSSSKRGLMSDGRRVIHKDALRGSVGGGEAGNIPAWP